MSRKLRLVADGFYEDLGEVDGWLPDEENIELSEQEVKRRAYYECLEVGEYNISDELSEAFEEEIYLEKKRENWRLFE